MAFLEIKFLDIYWLDLLKQSLNMKLPNYAGIFFENLTISVLLLDLDRSKTSKCFIKRQPTLIETQFYQLRYLYFSVIFSLTVSFVEECYLWKTSFFHNCWRLKTLNCQKMLSLFTRVGFPIQISSKLSTWFLSSRAHLAGFCKWRTMFFQNRRFTPLHSNLDRLE